jgi:hypothetical protein
MLLKLIFTGPLCSEVYCVAAETTNISKRKRLFKVKLMSLVIYTENIRSLDYEHTFGGK